MRSENEMYVMFEHDLLERREKKTEICSPLLFMAELEA